MKTATTTPWVTRLLVALSLVIESSLALAKQSSATGDTAAVAACSPESVQTGLAILQRGGNAADAAVAVLLLQTGVEWNTFCFGGEAVALVHRASDRSTEVIAGVGVAPALATREYFTAKSGIPTKSSPETGAVPSAFGACLTLLERHGTMTFTDVARPLLDYLDQQKETWRPAMARTLRRLIDSEQGAANRKAGIAQVWECFYRGEIARAVDAWSRKNGGLLRYEDFAAHTTLVEAPLAIEFRGRTILKAGPWSQGPMLLQTLRLLEGDDLRAHAPLDADNIHVVAEALKLSLSDRDAYYGDPRFAAVPLEALLSPRYAAERRSLIDPAKASAVWSPGRPRPDLPVPQVPRAVTRLADKTSDTTTCIVVDRHRNVVVVTPSGWGGVVAGDTGIVLASRLRSFNTWAGHPNCIAPGKRPRITLSPTLVLADGKPILAISVAGGDWQDQAALQVVLNSLVFGLSPTAAVSLPRWGTRHHVSSFDEKPVSPAHLLLPAEIASATADDLRRRGHAVKREKELVGFPAVIGIDPASGRLEAAADPKEPRNVAAY